MVIDGTLAALPLPIDPLLPEIVSSLRTCSGAVISAPPGAGKTSLAQLKALSLAKLPMEHLTPRQRSLLERETPQRLTINQKRSIRIHYEPARSPWIESRLLDFLGMQEAPGICSAQIPIVIHLLAPNDRAVQVKQDLAGFWKNHYPAVPRELRRRYPKHSWPDLGKG